MQQSDGITSYPASNGKTERGKMEVPGKEDVGGEGKAAPFVFPQHLAEANHLNLTVSLN